MASLFDFLIIFLQEHYYLSYIILFLGAYFETLIGPGFFIYGEIFFLSGSILAGAGYLNIWLVAVACIAGGWLGDNSSYFIGKWYGSAILKNVFRAKNKYLTNKNYQKGKKMFDTYGKKAIFFARFMGPISWITPFIAGTLHVKYKEFVKYNTPGVVSGIGLFLIIGYIFGFSYIMILPKLLADAFYIILILVVISVFYTLVKLGLFDYISKTILKIARS